MMDSSSWHLKSGDDQKIKQTHKQSEEQSIHVAIIDLITVN